MDERNKPAIWAAGAVALAILLAPSTLLLKAAARYKRAVDGLNAAALRPTRVRLIPDRDTSGPPPESSLSFVDFSARRPRAKSVGLVGDFNGWSPRALPMRRGPGGRWTLTLPLPRGRQRYLFIVDGEPELDSSSREVVEIDGRKASVKIVR
ncbi:MAG: hypothetical protein KGO96_07860 [Elusimicrobia bacterium]|nr:hypothetical protein [Elusimicrobiota bacterium]MDE2236988.1 hypothetical protein [Elusimicrobiota bacterium]MDE2425807.1 hypothetical protein [Elusimicrobiota bacterium]